MAAPKPSDIEAVELACDADRRGGRDAAHLADRSHDEDEGDAGQ